MTTPLFTQVGSLKPVLIGAVELNIRILALREVRALGLLALLLERLTLADARVNLLKIVLRNVVHICVINFI